MGVRRRDEMLPHLNFERGKRDWRDARRRRHFERAGHRKSRRESLAVGQLAAGGAGAEPRTERVPHLSAAEGGA